MKIKFNKTIVIFLLLVGFQNANAQEDFEDDTQDVPSAPISDYILPMALIGAYLGFRLMVKNKSKEA